MAEVFRVKDSGINGTAKIEVEKVNELERSSDKQSGVHYFDSELDAYKHALEVQNNVVNDLTGEFDSDEETGKQISLLTTLLAVSTANLAKVKGNERLMDIQVWINYYNRMVSGAMGNVDTTDKPLDPALKDEEVKQYVVQWLLAYMGRFCAGELTEKQQKEIVDKAVSSVDEIYSLILGANVCNELANNSKGQ